jgi:hypothetical protein
MLAMLPLLTLLSFAPTIGADCGEQVCVYASGENGSFKADVRLNKKQRSAEAKKNAKAKRVSVSVQVESGRGSAFIDGRYLAGEGPHAERALLPGRHEVEVRDGDRVIAVGILTIPRKASAVTLVVHADR